MPPGGIPAWILRKTTKRSRALDGLVMLRDNDPDFLVLVEKYFEELNKRILPYLSINGGPIILYAIENESIGDDTAEIIKAIENEGYVKGVGKPKSKGHEREIAVDEDGKVEVKITNGTDETVLYPNHEGGSDSEGGE